MIIKIIIIITIMIIISSELGFYIYCLQFRVSLPARILPRENKRCTDAHIQYALSIGKKSELQRILKSI